MNPVSKSAKNKSLNLLLGLIIAGLSIAVLEVGFIVLDLKLEFLPPGRPGWIEFSPTLHFGIRPGYIGVIYEAPVTINSQGFRNPEFSQVKGDTFRIVCPGNSCTFGNGLSYQDTYPAILQNLLRREFSDRIQVINAGIPGYSSYQGLILLQEKILSLRPDLLIVSYGFNDRRPVPDASWKDSPEFFRRDLGAQWRLDFFRRSYTFRFLQLLLAPKEIAIDGYEVRVDSLRYAENLRQTARIAVERGIPLIFLGIPDNPDRLSSFHQAQKLMAEGEYYRARKVLEGVKGHFARMCRRYFNRKIEEMRIKIEPLPEYSDLMSFHGGLPVYTGDYYNEIMAGVASEAGADYIDLSSVLDSNHYQDFVHFNAEGSRAAAEKLLRTIVSEGLIKTD